MNHFKVMQMIAALRQGPRAGLDFSFGPTLDEIGNTPYEIINQTRPANLFLFNRFLPEVLRPDYKVKRGSMVVRTVMAGLVGMDSEYPPTGFAETQNWNAETTKIANRAPLSEESLRSLQQLWLTLGRDSGASNERMVQETLNFFDKVIVQAHLDTFEWMRGQVLSKGRILWKFGDLTLDIDYQIPVANRPAKRTAANGYGGTTSKWWEDYRAARKALGPIRAIIAHSTTIDLIRYNLVNNVVAVAEGADNVTLRRMNPTTNTFTVDSGEVINIIPYDLESEVFDPLDNTKTKLVPFLEPGIIIFIGAPRTRGYVVGSGATAQPESAIGFTHIAPTVEGSNRPGRWGRVYTPENRPMNLIAEGVTNGLPVLDEPGKIYIVQTDMV